MSYVHGYSAREMERLEDQSRILSEILHSGTHYPAGSLVLEPGCGVGAQSVILGKSNPHAAIISLDISSESIAQARENIKQHNLNNIIPEQGSIYDIPYPDEHFDHVFICFVLEHLDDPGAALQECKRVLKTGGTLTAIEGDHGSCFWHPETDESLLVWNALITAQRNLGHDPNIGRRLYPLLSATGLQVEDVAPRYIYGDFGKFTELQGMVHRIIVPMVMSSKEQILGDQLVTPEIWEKGINDLGISGTPPNGTFFYTWFKGLAIKK